MSLLLAALLALDDWYNASAEFRKAMGFADAGKLESAIVEVTRDNSARAAKLLLQGLETPNPTFYWLIVTGLSRISEAEGVGVIVAAILAKNTTPPVKRDLMMALQMNASPAAVDAL